MPSSVHHIPLAVGIEIRPPGNDVRFVLDRAQSERLAGFVAEDLAVCSAAVTLGRLLAGPALLEPGQVLSPARGAFRTLIEIASREADGQPGVIALGASGGRIPYPALMPGESIAGSLFVCLPLLLSVSGSVAAAIETDLEQRLFDLGGLRPPALATLADCTGLEPVHGQLLTRMDLMALLKMQLAGARLDPFWPPVEHAILEPERRGQLDLPAGLTAQWLPRQACWQFGFEPLPAEPGQLDDYARWLRAFRQTAALLDACLIDWQVSPQSSLLQTGPSGHWLVQQARQSERSREPGPLLHHDVGLIGYVDASGNLLLPLDKHGIDELREKLKPDSPKVGMQ